MIGIYSYVQFYHFYPIQTREFREFMSENETTLRKRNSQKNLFAPIPVDSKY